MSPAMSPATSRPLLWMCCSPRSSCRKTGRLAASDATGHVEVSLSRTCHGTRRSVRLCGSPPSRPGSLSHARMVRSHSCIWMKSTCRVGGPRPLATATAARRVETEVCVESPAGHRGKGHVSDMSRTCLGHGSGRAPPRGGGGRVAARPCTSPRPRRTSLQTARRAAPRPPPPSTPGSTARRARGRASPSKSPTPTTSNGTLPTGSTLPPRPSLGRRASPRAPHGPARAPSR